LVGWTPLRRADGTWPLKPMDWTRRRIQTIRKLTRVK